MALPPKGCIFTMADRYQDRPFPSDADHDRGANVYVRRESDKLWELAQLTGQTDLCGTPAKTPVPLQSRANVRPQYALAKAASAPAGPPPWRLRARREAPPLQEYDEPEQPSPVHLLLRYAASPATALRTGPSRATTRHGRAAWPDQIRRAGICSRSDLSGRSFRLSERL